MDRFPQMLYCLPARDSSIAVLTDGAYGTKIVADEAEFDTALADGWFETSPAAKQAFEDAKAAALDAAEKSAEEAAKAALSDSTKPPTRDELEPQCAPVDTDRLGVPFSPRVSDKKLSAMVAAAAQTSDEG